MKTLHEEKRALEEKLGVFSQSSEEERDKALILASEKKAKGQVRHGCHGDSHEVCDRWRSCGESARSSGETMRRGKST